MTNEPTTLPPQGGILLIDKAGDWTSHDVVAKSRRALGTRKVGHAGTLDPMATGLLVLGAGPATRLLTHLVGLDKTYLTTIRLGITTVTDDREGDRVAVADPAALAAVLADPARIAAAVAELTGDIDQAPSAVSAIKVDGRRAYDRVRAGEQVELKRRPVTIHAFEIGEPRSATAEDGTPVIDLDATVRCSTGTYVRALARDLGELLGVGGHLTALRRTTVGPFDVADATSMDDLVAGSPGPLLTPTAVAERLFPVLALTEQQTIDLGHGKRVDVGAAADADLVAAVAPDGRLVGLVKITGGRTRIVTNFPTPDGGAGA
ncbi:tRNA pseudouridine(55) synthase TruB [Leucobacter rhizosphaerae]|uniref:tRNA pseudouridine synthase B n=1 Tax=Leucobacter rhizosphaerae TaxID=2932245 RepID=A0ABY4FZA4_9MICO|nr:tRNA pseudouridine(55) synthase TruB [Leucobacter rhizosphaerae]UOQ61637.1 tRNA pseudouridine(55) synthase TruB [Leucobacter rhizosphaerae]